MICQHWRAPPATAIDVSSALAGQAVGAMALACILPLGIPLQYLQLVRPTGACAPQPSTMVKALLVPERWQQTLPLLLHSCPRGVYARV